MQKPRDICANPNVYDNLDGSGAFGDKCCNGIGCTGCKHELVIADGHSRFNCGLVAFPEYVFCSKDGYVMIQGIEYCCLCASKSGQEHCKRCTEMYGRVKTMLKRIKFYEPSDACQVTYNETKCQSIPAFTQVHFGVLGETASMHHVENTVEVHKCYYCNSTFEHLPKDPLLCEYLYNTGLRCPSVSEGLTSLERNVKALIGKDRYRKGFIAYPDILVDAAYGYTAIYGPIRCIVCSAITHQGKPMPIQGHQQKCCAMKNMVIANLKNTVLLPFH